MNSTPSSIRDVPPSELTACLQWLLEQVRVERAQWIVAQLTERVKRKRIADILAVEAVSRGVLVGAAIAVLQSPHAANLLAISQQANGGNQAIGNAPRSLDSAVFGRLIERLQAAHVTFLQTSTEADDEGQHLVECGFDWVANLAFLVLESEDFGRVPEANTETDCRFDMVGDDKELLAIACEVAVRTFSGTRDCPRLSDYRSGSQIVDGYRMAPNFDPTLWHLLRIGTEPAGCLILNRHPGADTGSEETAGSSGGVFEVGYMGLVPEYRGRGLGEVVLAKAVQVARQRNAIRMVLAVDLENSPAITLYRRCGWVQAAQESVWALRI
jgi:GNAT superfamily N-acetyltransferase